MRDAVIADLDGTLCDVSSILHHVEGEERRTSRQLIWRVISHSSEPSSRLIWIYAIAMGAFQGSFSVLALFLDRGAHEGPGEATLHVLIDREDDFRLAAIVSTDTRQDLSDTGGLPCRIRRASGLTQLSRSRPAHCCKGPAENIFSKGFIKLPQNISYLCLQNCCGQFVRFTLEISGYAFQQLERILLIGR